MEHCILKRSLFIWCRKELDYVLQSEKKNNFPPTESSLYLLIDNQSVNTWCVQVLRSPKEAFAAAMQSWRERCEKCLCLQGDYVEN